PYTTHYFSLHDALPIYGVLALLRIEHTEARAQAPIGRRTVRDAEARTEIVEVGVDQPVAEASIPGELHGAGEAEIDALVEIALADRKSTRLNSSHEWIS